MDGPAPATPLGAGLSPLRDPPMALDGAERKESFMLTMFHVIPYLQAKNFLDAESVVEGRVRVFDVSRRNRNFRVARQNGPSFFIKQGERRGDFSPTAHEATVYTLLTSTQRPAAERLPIPRLLDYDTEHDVLILEHIEQAKTLRDHHITPKRLPTRVATSVGRMLATLHRHSPVEELASMVGQYEPGALSVHRPGSALLRDFSNSSIELVRMVQSSPELVEELENLRRGWRNDTLIHHDLRWDNILVTTNRRTADITLIDWETAAIGDPAWDVGSIIGDYLVHWLRSIPMTGQRPPNELLPLARVPLASVQPAVMALWRAYVCNASDSRVAQPEFLRTVVRFTGLKLIQSALEMVQKESNWNLAAVACLQVAANMMARPDEAAQSLLGLEA